MSATKRSAAGTTVVLLLLSAVVAIPLLWMVISSFRPSSALFVRPPTFLPTEVTMEWYEAIFMRSGAFTMIANSAIVATGATIASVGLATLGAYSVTRFRYPGRKVFVLASLAAYVFPAVVLFVPLYSLINSAHLINTHLGLIIVHTIIELPFSLWILRSFFSAVPIELDEAAVMDGASLFRVFWQIMLPLARPGLIATGLLAFIMSWSEYLFASVFMTSAEMKTLPVGIAEYVAGFDVRWGEVMALSVVATLPILLLFMLLQRSFIAGLTAGAVKG